MSYKIKGKITQVIDKSGVSKKGENYVSFRYGITEVDVEHPQSAVIDAFGDKLPKLSVGQIVEIDFNMRMQEYNGNIYHSNNAWRIEAEKG